MCTRHPVHLASSITCAMARFSAPLGRDDKKFGVRLAVRRRRMLDGVGVLCMHDHQAVEGGDLAHGRLELFGVHGRELVDTGVQQEAFEAEDARVVQRTEVTDVAGNGAAPEPDVDMRLGLCGLALHLERGDVDGGRNAVERHVDQRRDSPCGSGPRRAGEPLPLGAAGIVDVHMRIDDAGKQRLVANRARSPAVPSGLIPSARWRRSCRPSRRRCGSPRPRCSPPAGRGSPDRGRS